MKRLWSDPRVYATWPVLVIACLYAAYLADPYIFGLAVFALGAATVLMLPIGTFFTFTKQGVGRSTKLAVLAALILSVLAILGALAMLGRFQWA